MEDLDGTSTQKQNQEIELKGDNGVHSVSGAHGSNYEKEDVSNLEDTVIWNPLHKLNITCSP
jgi:hypothetical protein